MDAERFDSLTRVLTTAGSRRRVLAAALAGALGLQGRLQPDDAAAGRRCKPKCSECERCKKGKKGRKGKCKAKSNGTACSTGTCQGGNCSLRTCSSAAECGSDANGGCLCAAPRSGGSKVCLTNTPTGDLVLNCNACPGGTTCVYVNASKSSCYKGCGAP